MGHTVGTGETWEHETKTATCSESSDYHFNSQNKSTACTWELLRMGGLRSSPDFGIPLQHPPMAMHDASPKTPKMPPADFATRPPGRR